MKPCNISATVVTLYCTCFRFRAFTPYADVLNQGLEDRKFIAMKYVALILSAMLCNCSPYLAPIDDIESNASVQIIVECKNEKQVETAAIQALKFVRINDLEKETSGQALLIKARYKELSAYQARQIKEDLQLILGVLDIQIVKDGLPLKNSF